MKEKQKKKKKLVLVIIVNPIFVEDDRDLGSYNARSESYEDECVLFRP